MKAILSFNLPEDQAEHMQAINAAKVIGIIEEWSNRVRALDKYESTAELPATMVECITDEKQNKVDAIIECRNMLTAMLYEGGCSLFEN